MMIDKENFGHNILDRDILTFLLRVKNIDVKTVNMFC